MKNKLYTFEADLKNRLKDPEFQRLWHETEPEFQLAQRMIEKRLEQKLTQRDLAKKIQASPATVSKIETMQANPSFSLLKRIASALNCQIQVSFS